MIFLAKYISELLVKKHRINENLHKSLILNYADFPVLLMAFTFYILFSESRNKFYPGHTGADLEERIRKHKSEHKGFTGKSGDWSLIHFENFYSKPAAVKREWEVKT